MITAIPARWMALAAGISRPPVLSITTRATLCFLRYSIVWAIPFGLLVSVLVLDKDENGDDEVSFGDVDACVIVLGTHHKPALHSVVLSGNCPVVSMGCPTAP